MDGMVMIMIMNWWIDGKCVKGNKRDNEIFRGEWGVHIIEGCEWIFRDNQWV